MFSHDGIMQRFECQEFVDVMATGARRVVSHLEFVRCSFWACGIYPADDPADRSTARDLRFVNCQENACMIDGAVVEDTLVEGLRSAGGIFRTYGTAFKHVTLRGKFGRVMFSPLISPSRADRRQEAAYLEANAKYYSGADWALDISEGEFIECDIRGIPARLIRRDPGTQFVVTRSSALRRLEEVATNERSFWEGILALSVLDDDPDFILVAPKRDHKFNEKLNGLKMLRDIGVAEPD